MPASGRNQTVGYFFGARISGIFPHSGRDIRRSRVLGSIVDYRSPTSAENVARRPDSEYSAYACRLSDEIYFDSTDIAISRPVDVQLVARHDSSILFKKGCLVYLYCR
jgi:hypothetical protein